MQHPMNRSIAIAALVLALGACSADEPKQAAAPAAGLSGQSASVASQSAVEPAVEQVVQAAGNAAEQAGEEIAAAAGSVAQEVKQSAEAIKPSAMAARQASESLAAAAAAARSPVPVAEKPDVAEPAAAKAAAAAPAVSAPAVKQLVEKVAAPAAVSAPSGNADAGKQLARKCATCHSFDSANKMGPGLAGVFDRVAGTAPGFKYTFAAFIQPGKAWRWDASHLAAWVCSSTDAVRHFTSDDAAKTKMNAQRICDPAQQADLIAYLKTL